MDASIKMLEDTLRNSPEYYTRAERDSMAQTIADFYYLTSSMAEAEKENRKHMEEIRSYYFRY